MLTNELGLPKPFVDAVTSDYQYKPKRYSVTDLLGGTCAAVLKRRHANEGSEDVSDMLWVILGSAVHKVLEDSEAEGDQRQEYHMVVDLDRGYQLSGIADLYTESTATVTDYKTCSTWKFTFGDFEEWRKQTLLYCWMLRQLGHRAEHGEITAIMRDHNMRKARFEPEYPAHPVAKLSWDFSEGDLAEAESYVMEWFAEVRYQETLEDDFLEPCSDEQVWHKPDKWAVMRKGQKKAVKLFDSEDAALEFMDWLADQPSNKGKALYVEHRPGEDTRCQSYCPVAQWCPRGRKYFRES